MKQRDSKKRSSEGSGSSWTSYSDLFTSLAVVFLVMFVFALIKAAVSNVKMVKNNVDNEKKLEGKVTKKEKEEFSKKEKEITDSISEIDQYNDVIDKKIKDLNQFVVKLSSQKKIMKDLLKDRKEKQAILNNINHVIEKKNLKLKELENEVAQFDYVQQKNESDKSKLENELLEARKVLDDVADEKNVQEKLIEQLNEKITQTENSFKAKNESYKKLKSITDKTIENLNVRLSDQQKSFQKNLQDKESKISHLMNEISKKVNKVDELANELDRKRNVIGELESQNKNLTIENNNWKGRFETQEKELGQAYNELDGLENELKKVSKGYEDLKGNYKGLQGEMKKRGLASSNEIKGLKGELDGVRGSYEKLGSKYGDLEDQYGNLKSAYGNLNNDYQSLLSDKVRCDKEVKKITKYKNKLDKEKAAVRKIASIQNSIRTNIAENLAKRFREANLPVVVDRLTGNIVFQMDDLFLFKNNSAELTPEMIDKLKKIIPIYADELFGKEDIAKHILRINIEGHASPTYKRNFVDPENADPESYGYNLDLSTRRASQLAQFIFNEDNIQYPFQFKMRKMTSAIGYSFSQAIKKDFHSEICGHYDCPKSRRVILSFTLNNNQMIIDAFEKQRKVSFK